MLPSFSTITIVPVSAIPKLTPLMPTSAAAKRSRSVARAVLRHLGNIVSRRHAEFGSEELGDLSARFMNRGRDDVRRRLVRKLNDVLTEICFDHLHAGSFERVVEMRLFGRHALALDDDARVSFCRQAADDRVCFGSVARPVNFRAATLRVAHKLFEIPIEMQ